MKKIFVITSLFALLALPAFAQAPKEGDAAQEEAGQEVPSAEEVNAAAKAINAFVEDKAKLDGYCAILKEMEQVKEGDDAKAEELGQKMDTYISGLSEDVQDAFAVADSVAPESEDAKKIDEAFEKIDEKCGL